MSGSETGSIIEAPVIIPYRPIDEARRVNQARAEEFWTGLGFNPGFYDSGHEKFNRAASINLGVTATESEFLIVADLDVTGDPELIRDSLTRARDGNVHIPYRELYFYDESGAIPGPPYIGNMSCIQAMARATYEFVGGNDARFSGWGFEDNAFSARVTGAGRKMVVHEGGAWHHWHPVYWRVGDEAYEANRLLWENEY